MEKNIVEKKHVIDQLPAEDLIHNLDQPSSFSKLTILAVLVIIAAGIISGYILSHKVIRVGSSTSSVENSGKTQDKKTVGVSDEKTFPDSAEGTLETGGFSGEGTHKLTRQGGDSQTVYLTSSVIDLEEFVGKKVKVWGATFSAKKAGWLMDVGKVEVL